MMDSLQPKLRALPDFVSLISQNSPDYLTNDFTNMKRYRDIDYDSFVGLMGRRSAGESHVLSWSWRAPLYCS